MRPDSTTIAPNRIGTIASATPVMSQSSRSMTTIIPPSSTIDVRIGKKPFIVSVWIANVSAVVVSIINLMIRLGDETARVDSLGVYLSGAVVLILLFSGWRGGDLVYVHRVAVHEPGTRP